MVTPGLDEVVRGMKAGGTRLAVVPPALGYGVSTPLLRTAGTSCAASGNRRGAKRVSRNACNRGIFLQRIA